MAILPSFTAMTGKSGSATSHISTTSPPRQRRLSYRGIMSWW
jgi:hypothetical protein